MSLRERRIAKTKIKPRKQLAAEERGREEQQQPLKSAKHRDRPVVRASYQVILESTAVTLPAVHRSTGSCRERHRQCNKSVCLTRRAAAGYRGISATLSS